MFVYYVVPLYLKNNERILLMKPLLIEAQRSDKQNRFKLLNKGLNPLSLETNYASQLPSLFSCFISLYLT